MSNPCDSCAFHPGAAAHNELYNRLRGEICAITGVPFWCHHGKDGTDYTNSSKFVSRSEIRARGMRVCEGWKAEVRKHVAAGSDRWHRRLIRRWRGEAALDTGRKGGCARPPRYGNPEFARGGRIHRGDYKCLSTCNQQTGR